ncbi:MAG: hypothetical protein AAFV49_06690 [Pseudomonadota bacterium]
MRWFGKAEGEPPRLIDNAYIARLAGHIGTDVARELLADGAIELVDRADRLKAGVAAGDRAAVVKLSHDLIAIAGHLGLSALSFAAVDLNRGLRTGEGESRSARGSDRETAMLEKHAAGFLALCDPSINALDAIVKGRAALGGEARKPGAPGGEAPE